MLIQNINFGTENDIALINNDKQFNDRVSWVQLGQFDKRKKISIPTIIRASSFKKKPWPHSLIK